MERKNTFIIAMLALATLALGGREPSGTRDTVTLVAPVALASPAPHASERNWDAVVNAYATETLTRGRALSETVAVAIEATASEFDINPMLLASLIRIESSGRPGAVSHVGAMGLTQVMPVTGAEIASKLRVAEYDLFDPATSVRFGGFYLAGLLDRFDGNEGAALAAYNYGPTYIARCLRNGDPLPVVYAGKIQTRLALR